MEKKLFVIIAFVIIYILNIDSKVFAQNCSGSPDDGQGCTNGGDLRNGCNWICNNAAPPGTILQPPSCCNILAQTGDPTVCCFDARRRCTPQQCASIPEGTLKQRCGQLWELGGYCNDVPTPTQSVIPTSKPTKEPTIEPTTQKTQPPIPTSQKPTTIIRVPPNESPAPVITNEFQNPRPTSASQQFEFPSVQFPKIALPKISINLVKINQAVRKPLGFFEYLFGKIVYYDRLLETTINTKINGLTK